MKYLIFSWLLSLFVANPFTTDTKEINLSQEQPDVFDSQTLVLGEQVAYKRKTPSPKPTFTPTPKPNAQPTPSPQPTPLPTTADLNTWFKKYSNEYSVDEQTLKKIAVCESKLNSQAQNGPYAGLYQFTISAWKTARNLMNLDPNPDLRFNPEEAIKTAAFKISRHGTIAWPNCR